MAPQERGHPLRHPGCLELVGEHRRHRDREVVGELEDRQVGAGDGVEEPFLAERIGAETLDVGHVRVEHDGQIPDGARDVVPAQACGPAATFAPEPGDTGGGAEDVAE